MTNPEPTLTQRMLRTIWTPGVIDKDERVAGIIRYVLPGVDVIAMLFGLVAFWRGLPIITEVYNDHLTALYGAMLMLCAGGALIGLVFCLQKLEVISKILLFALLVVYPASLILVGLEDFRRTANGVLCLMALPIIFWRLRDLGRQKGRES